MLENITNSGILTLPTSTDVIVARNTTDSMQNKTIIRPKILRIDDSSNNEFMTFTSGGGSSDTYINLTTSILGSGPILAAVGSSTQIDFNLVAGGSGNINISGIKYPNTDGTNNQALITNGTGVLSFSDVQIENTNTVSTPSGAITTLQTISVSTSSTIFIESSIVAHQTDDSTQGGGYVIRGTFNRSTGSVSQLGLTDLLSMESNSAWNVSFAVSSGDVLLQVQGVSSTNINWNGKTRTIIIS